MCPRRRVKIGQDNLQNSKKRTQIPCSHFPTNGVSQSQREFVVDSGASMHMLSRKDLNSAELETVRVYKSPTTVVTANGEVQTKEEATVYVKDLDFFVTVSVSKIHRPFSHSENFTRITDILTSRPVVRNHNSSKIADE